MKKIFAVVFLSISLFLAVFAQSSAPYDIWFTWTPNPASEMVGGYRMEYQKFPTVTNWTLLTVIPATTNVAIVKGLQGGFTYKFRMFATNSFGISTNQSNIIQIPTNMPSGVSGYTLTNAPK